MSGQDDPQHPRLERQSLHQEHQEGHGRRGEEGRLQVHRRGRTRASRRSGSRAWTHAINNKFDLIDLLGGTDPRVLAPQVQEPRRPRASRSSRRTTTARAVRARPKRRRLSCRSTTSRPAHSSPTGRSPDRGQDERARHRLGRDRCPTKIDGQRHQRRARKHCDDGCKHKIHQRAGARLGDEDPAERAVGAARRSDDQLHHPDLRQHVPVRGAGGDDHRQAATRSRSPPSTARPSSSA